MASYSDLLNSEQIQDILTGNCYRVIDNMDHDDLVSYAMEMMMQSFDNHPGAGDVNVDMLIEDILTAEGEQDSEDSDSTFEFINGVVNDNDLTESVMNRYLNDPHKFF
jgi:hypothetical protein